MKRAILIPLVALALGCGPEPSARLRFDAGEGVPDYGAHPFPSDRYLVEGRLVAPAGLERATPLESDLVAAHLETLDGFGLRPVLELFVEGAVDAASAARSIRLVEVETGLEAATEWRFDPVRGRLAGATRLGTTLREDTRYALVVTRGLLDADGAPLRRPPGFDPTPFAELLARLELPAGEVLLVEPFTTQRATRVLDRARAAAEAAPAPALRFGEAALIFRGPEALDALLGVAERDESGAERWGWSNPTGIAHDHVGVIATGTLTAPRFLRPDDGTHLPDSHTFEIDEAGEPRIIEPAAPMPVTLALPASPPPAAGYPVAIFGHGLGASRHQLLTFAEPLNARGWAVAAVDMAGFGSRFRDVDEGNNLAELLTDFSGDPELRDGLGDLTGIGSTFGFLHELKNLSAMRDAIRQSVLDQGALARALARDDLDLSALAPGAALDGDRVVYLGESFGGVVGSVLAAVEPELDLFVLNVPGGGVLDLALLGSPTMRPMVELWLNSTYGLDERLDRFHPAVGLGQAILDGADPLSFAPRALRDRLDGRGPRHVILLEAVGDEVMPNRSTHALARAFGAPLLAPFAVEVPGLPVVEGPVSANVDGQTAALVQWSPATHGTNWSSDEGRLRFHPFGEGDDEDYEMRDASLLVENPLRGTLEQVGALLDSSLEGPPRLSPTQIAR